MSESGTNHTLKTEGCPPLSEQQAREQLLYELQDQIGTVTFDVEDRDQYPQYDGVVVAYVNGQRADHYLFAEKDDDENCSVDTGTARPERGDGS